MPQSRRLIIATIVTFIAGLVLMFPARVGYHWFAPPGVGLSELSGTLWSGSARDAEAAGLYLTNLKWRMRPLHLLTGKLAFKFEATPTGGFIDGDAALSFGGDVHLTDLRGSVPLVLLEQATGFRGLRGMANADLERLHLSDGIPIAAEGILEVASLIMPLVAREPIGGYKAEFSTQEEGIVASVEDTDGVIDIAGRLVLGADRSYQFIGQLAPKPQTPASVRQQMQFLGTANERGQYELRLEGAL